MTLSALRLERCQWALRGGRRLCPPQSPPAGPPFEKGTLHLVGAKSACLRFRLWRNLRPLPCSSSPHKVLRLCGTPSPCSPNGVPAPDSISGVISLASHWRSWRSIPFGRSFSCQDKKRAGHIHNRTGGTTRVSRRCCFQIVYVTGSAVLTVSLFSWPP